MSKYECSEGTKAVTIRNVILIGVTASDGDIQKHHAIAQTPGSQLLSPEKLVILSVLGQKSIIHPRLFCQEAIIMLDTPMQASLCEPGGENTFPPHGWQECHPSAGRWLQVIKHDLVGLR